MPTIHSMAAIAWSIGEKKFNWIIAVHTRRFDEFFFCMWKLCHHFFQLFACGFIFNVTVINGTHPTLRADPYSPGIVLRALHALGWVIPPDEHDAHELLHVVLSSLEEEAIRPKKVSEM